LQTYKNNNISRIIDMCFLNITPQNFNNYPTVAESKNPCDIVTRLNLQVTAIPFLKGIDTLVTRALFVVPMPHRDLYAITVALRSTKLSACTGSFSHLDSHYN
jgi:hypothetical protein